ncbi:MOSC N-terminal beta barrel domain-containing protein [Simiduia aestuariiviva]|uniref:MOSC domain-containing protein n=1 Tax=Simiduia aestuariiviva TaxID=1510459 RepID=A0A839UUJ3_9GAMM|nr:hypothetical protein [Simiduia aestuariiviva]
MAITVTDLFIYPVKSLRGLRLERASLDIRGLADDRRWMIIDQHQRFVTQRTLPALVTIHTHLTDDGLWLQSPDSECRVSKIFSGDPTPITAHIWSDEVQVLDEGPAVGQWLTEVLKHTSPLRLVRLSDQPRPRAKPEYLGPAHTVFADMAPLLIANQASLDALNHALVDGTEAPVPMDRFRPNIVLTGLNAFSEHRIARLRHSDFSLALAYPCERCVVTTVDQTTGQRHPQGEPFPTLTRLNPMPAYGSGAHAKPANLKAPAFAENAYLTGAERGLLMVGDRLWVDELRTLESPPNALG